MTAKHARKAYTTFVQHLVRSLYQREVELTLMNGCRGLSLKLHHSAEFDGVAADLSPREARELAAELIARADEIDAVNLDKVIKQ